MGNKSIKKLVFFSIVFILLFSGCVSNPLTGQRTMALVSNRELFPMSFAMFDEFVAENTVVTGTRESEMLNRVGNRLAHAAQLWLTAEGVPNYMNDYRWEFVLIQDNTVNAWVLPGGKVVFYTGILPITQSEAGMAVVMGHEIAHALLNHGQQRMSAGILQEIASLGVAVLTSSMSTETQAVVMTAFGLGTTLGATLPFSRKHELEADEYGAILMAIAGYDPGEGAAFWERMMALSGGGSVPEFLSTHPSNASRVRNLHNLVPKAKRRAAQFGVYFD